MPVSRRFSILLFLLLLAVACREPRSVEQFIAGDGPFVFRVDFSDSTAVYDMDLYTRVDAHVFPPEQALLMRWQSPSDSVYRETVYLPLSREVYVPYRQGVAPYEWGEWTLTVSSPSPWPVGLRGLGLVVRKQER